MTTLELAALTPAFRGPYSSDEEYKFGQLTRWNNSLYWASQNVRKGISPSNGSYWILALQGTPPGALPQLSKADHDAVVFSKTGPQTISVKAETAVVVNGEVIEFAAATPVTNSATLVAGTDYAVFVCDDGSVRADVSFSAPASYAPAQCRRIGGFHYGLANLNIDATPHINEFSMWDTLFRPACIDPRGMALVADRFWADIYPCGINHHSELIGTSKAGEPIATGTSPPKIPEIFGGNGSSDFGAFTCYHAALVMGSWEKRLPSYEEFSLMAFGVTEQQSAGSAQATTGHLAGHVSKWGLEQITGVVWQWGNDFGGPDSGGTPAANTEGRGSVTNQPNAVLLGGAWNAATQSGSRAGAWNNQPAASQSTFGARGVAEHQRV